MAEIVVAVVGDSISAGSPLWDPDPAVRARIPAPDEQSQWQWWVTRADARLEFRTTAVYGERTDQIARRLDLVLSGADVLVVQGGINDVVQGRPLEAAARTSRQCSNGPRSRARARRHRRASLEQRRRARRRRHPAPQRADPAARGRRGATLLPFHDTLVDPADPSRMGEGLSDDGDHPSVEGHRLLGERAFRRSPN